MTTYQMDCSCGDTMNVEGASREESVSKFKAMMNESVIAAHMKEKHPGEPSMQVAQVHSIIEKNVKVA